jgi:hypothetical protein
MASSLVNTAGGLQVNQSDRGAQRGDQEADRVLVVVSPEYRERFEGTGHPEIGRGVQFEGLIIREDIYRDQRYDERRQFTDLVSRLVQSGAISRWEVEDKVRQLLEWLAESADRVMRSDVVPVPPRRTAATSDAPTFGGPDRAGRRERCGTRGLVAVTR